MSYLNTVRIVFADENEVYNIKVDNRDLEKLLYRLNDYGIYAEKIKPAPRRTTKLIYVYGKGYSSIREFSEITGLEPNEVYKYNSRHCADGWSKRILMEHFVSERIANRLSHLNVSQQNITDLIRIAITQKKFSYITLDNYSDDNIDVYSVSDDGSTICTIKHMKEFYYDIKNI
jgi:hypothetical protein